MANKGIKGITYTVGGDTTGLNEALKGVNTRAKDLNSELNKVNRLMKLDPSNTVLLTQKQDLLNKSINETKEKLNTLKDAQSQVEEQFKNGDIGEEQYRSFQQEIEKTEQKLKSLENQAKNTGSVLGTNLQNAGTKISNAGEKISGVGTKLLPVTGVIAGVGTAAAKMGMDFEESSAKVSTIADTTQESMSKLESGVMQLSNETGESADSLNEALYQTISAGVKTSDSIGFLGTATKLAKGGFTDSSTAIDTLTSVINAYGLKATDATKISDQLIQTQNLGKTTVAELGQALGGVIPIASTMGVKTQDLFASLAELTKNGIKTDEAVTGMKGALSNILKPTSDASKMAQQLGIDFSEAHLKNVGWPKFLDEVKEKTGGSSEKMAKLFGNVRSLNAVLTLTGKGSADFKTILQEMGDTAGSTDSAFAKMENNGASKWEKAVNKMKNAGIKLGESLEPIVEKVSAAVTQIADKFNSLSPAQQQMIIKIAGITAVIAPLLIVIGKMTTGVGAITKGLGKTITAVSNFHKALSGGASLAKALSAALTPAGAIVAIVVAIIAAVALLVVGIKHLYDTNANFRNSVNTVWNGIKTVITTVVNAIVGFFTTTIPNAWNGLVALFNSIPAWWNGLWTSVGQFFTNLWNGIGNFFTQTIPQWINNFINFFNELPEKIGEIIGTLLADIVNFGVSAFNWVTNDLPKIINGIINWFAQLPGKIWTWLLNTLTKIKQWGTDTWNYLSQQIPKIINGIGTWFSQLPSKVWTWLVNTLDKVKTWCSNLISTASTEIPKFVNKVVDFMKELPKDMLDIGKNIVHGIWDGINGAISWLHDRISDFCSGIVKGFKDHLKIHSPSQVFADEVGKYMALGIGQGFTDNMASVTKQMQAAIPTNFALDIGTSINGINGLKTAYASAQSCNMSTYNTPVNFNVKLGNITVQGNADQNALAQMKQITQDQAQYLINRLCTIGAKARTKVK